MLALKYLSAIKNIESEPLENSYIPVADSYKLLGDVSVEYYIQRISAISKYLMKVRVAPTHGSLSNSAGKICIDVEQQVIVTPNANDDYEDAEIPQRFEVKGEMLPLVVRQIVEIFDYKPAS